MIDREKLLKDMGALDLSDKEGLKDVRARWTQFKIDVEHECADDRDAQAAILKTVYDDPWFQHYRKIATSAWRQTPTFKKMNARKSRKRYAEYKAADPNFLTAQAERKRAAYYALKGVPIPPKKKGKPAGV